MIQTEIGSFDLEILRRTFPQGVALAEAMAGKGTAHVEICLPCHKGKKQCFNVNQQVLLGLLAENSREDHPIADELAATFESAFREALSTLADEQAS